MITPILTKAEAKILTQLRDKPMSVVKILTESNEDSFDKCSDHSFLRMQVYIQEWKGSGSGDHFVMTICHLTHKGRMALIEHEKNILTD